MLNHYLIDSKEYLNSKFPQEFSIDRLIDLNVDQLKRAKFLALILDYDGVLCSQGEIIPKQEVIDWLRKALLIFGSKRIFILSNNPLRERQEFFSKHFKDEILFIVSKPKPNTQGMSEIYNYCKLSFGSSINKTTILMIDDRVTTGVLAAKIFGISACLVLKPYTNFGKQFIIEAWFSLLRRIERLML